MASPASSSSSTSSSSGGPPAAALSDEDLDRRLQQRLANLSESAPIHLSLPPPSAEQLEERLRKLEASRDQTHSDEAELQRRFQKLNGHPVTAASSSSASSSSPALYSNRDIQLAGHGAGLSEQEEVEALLQQVQQHTQLEAGHMASTSHGAAPPMPSLCEGHQNVSTRKQSAELTRPTTTSLAAAGTSPPPPSRSEVAALMRELSSLPDTDLLAPAQRGSSSAKKKKKSRANDEESGANSESEGSETDTDVQDIINQACDEASMEQ